MTILHTPSRFRHILWVGFDRNARPGDELLGLSIGNAYLGIYPTSSGFEVAWGILNANEAL